MGYSKFLFRQGGNCHGLVGSRHMYWVRWETMPYSEANHLATHVKWPVVYKQFLSAILGSLLKWIVYLVWWSCLSFFQRFFQFLQAGNLGCGKCSDGVFLEFLLCLKHKQEQVFLSDNPWTGYMGLQAGVWCPCHSHRWHKVNKACQLSLTQCPISSSVCGWNQQRSSHA